MNEPKISAARLAEGLVRGSEVAVLATLDRTSGEPYASLALLAVDHDAAPLLLLSTLAEHTQNISQDDRVSLLIDGTAGLESRLAGARLSVQGRAALTAEPRHRARFLARHSDAAGYADFADFDVYRVKVARAHLVAGFGQIEWIDAAEFIRPEALALPLVDAEAGVIEHMNRDHADALDLYAQALAGENGEGWSMTGCDSAGFDLRNAGRVCRIEFESAIEDANGARAELVRLVARAREILRKSADSP